MTDKHYNSIFKLSEDEQKLHDLCLKRGMPHSFHCVKCDLWEGGLANITQLDCDHVFQVAFPNTIVDSTPPAMERKK